MLYRLLWSQNTNSSDLGVTRIVPILPTLRLISQEKANQTPEDYKKDGSFYKQEKPDTKTKTKTLPLLKYVKSSPVY